MLWDWVFVLSNGQQNYLDESLVYTHVNIHKHKTNIHTYKYTYIQKYIRIFADNIHTKHPYKTSKQYMETYMHIHILNL